MTAPVGGVLKSGRRKVIVERTLLTARSIEFDALVVAGGDRTTDDIKLVVLLQEAFRHCKAIAAWGDGAAALDGCGHRLRCARSTRSPITSTSRSPAALASAVGLHRVWERAPKVMASGS